MHISPLPASAPRETDKTRMPERSTADADTLTPAPAAAASSIVTLSLLARQKSELELRESALEALSDVAIQQSQKRKRQEKLRPAPTLLELDVFSELREKLRAQLQQQPALTTAQRQQADEQFLQRQRDALPSSPQ